MSSQIENILADIARNEYLRMKEAQHLSISLLAGDMGSVVYLYEYSRLDPSYQPFADDLLGKVLSGMRRVRPEVTYCNGVAGMVIGLYALKRLDKKDLLLSPKVVLGLTGGNNTTNKKLEDGNSGAATGKICTFRCSKFQ